MVAALRVLLAAAWLLSGVVASSAENYPTRPVRVVVGFPAGGPTDAIARIVAQKLTDNLGQQFFVENIGGAGGNTAAGQVARVTPDGYTIMAISTGFVVNPSLYAKVPYDPIKDFAPVTLVAASPNIVVVNPQVPAKTLPELVQLIRDNPGKYSFAGPGVGSTPHLGGELFRLAFKLDLVHVPFTGAGPAVQATVGGHTPIAFTALPSSLSAVQGGQLRALGVASAERAAGLPDVPTYAEQGVKDQDADTLTGIVAPAGTPKEIVDLLYREIAKIVAQPDVKERLTRARFQSGRQYAGAVRRAHQAGDRQVGQGGARRKAADRVNDRVTALTMALTVSAIFTKVRPIRFFWIQATRHSCTTEESFAITRRKRCGTKAGFSTSIAAPSGEIFRTTQGMTEPPDETKAGSSISVRGYFRFSSMPCPVPAKTTRLTAKP